LSTPADYAQVANVISTLADAGKRPVRGKNPIPPAKPAGAAIGESIGEGRAGGAAASSAGAAIAGPFKEVPGTRLYHDVQDVFTEDGDLVKHWPVHKITMKDANGNVVPFEYEAPDYDNVVTG
jgi:hypothetical protein